MHNLSKKKRVVVCLPFRDVFAYAALNGNFEHFSQRLGAFEQEVGSRRPFSRGDGVSLVCLDLIAIRVFIDNGYDCIDEAGTRCVVEVSGCWASRDSQMEFKGPGALRPRFGDDLFACFEGTPHILFLFLGCVHSGRFRAARETRAARQHLGHGELGEVDGRGRGRLGDHRRRGLGRGRRG